MKYAHLKGSPNKEYVSWPGFSIETVTGSGAATLAEELNRLDSEVNRLNDCLRPKVTFFGGSHPKRHEGVTVDGQRYLLESIVEEDLSVQVEAKCNALRKVADLEALGVEMERKLKGTPSNRALKQRLGVRTSQLHELLTVLERAQGILAGYIEPNGRVKPREALTDLLVILDDSALVTMMNNLRELIGVKDNGSVELTKEQKIKVLSALDNLAMAYPWKWPQGMRDNYENACRILGASEDGDVANGSQKKFPEVGAEMLVTLKRMPDGKQYVSGIGVGIEQPFIVQGEQVFINGACIDPARFAIDKLTSAISATQLGEALHERVVNNTTNHFGLKKKDIRRIVIDTIRKEQMPGGLLHRD